MSEPGDRASKAISSQGARLVNVCVGHGVSPENGRGEDAPAGVQGVRRAQKFLAQKLGDLGGASLPVALRLSSRFVLYRWMRKHGIRVDTE